MLREGQIAYLNSLEPERAGAPVIIKPYNPKLAVVAENVIGKIKKAIPNSDVRFMGASALKISGQNDIDIYIITSDDVKGQYIKKLEPTLGILPGRKWHWYENGVEISVNLSDPNHYKLKEHLALFKILTTEPDILKEYENLKISMDGKSYKDYQIAKYQFYNRILKLE